MSTSSKGGAGAPERIRVAERADGFYWRDPESLDEVGPFKTYDAALAYAENADGDEDATTLSEAETALGLSDWVDPDTGLPAEDHVPHIADDDY
ncbi:hypothetical protein GCM10025771_07630 [Niveibacterium umoris]|uniref:Uncharacterized protein n=1 Tax=Niveibacterium umoris TaxID=1193620 RepID=A0A840BL17_9RHOO|nr:hypothetical protein [Niveibacterium umoris]MBB4013690.1 hypothetical protein [Niveibacterium umoris]